MVQNVHSATITFQEQNLIYNSTSVVTIAICNASNIIHQSLKVAVFRIWHNQGWILGNNELWHNARVSKMYLPRSICRVQIVWLALYYPFSSIRHIKLSYVF